MKLRSQSLSVIIIATTTLLFMTTFLVGTLQMSRFAELERQQVKDASLCALASAKNTMEAQIRLNEDWAWWNSTYDFVSSEDLYFVNENIPPESLWDNDLSFVVIFDNEHTVVWSSMLGEKRPDIAPVPSSIIQSIGENLTTDERFRTKSFSGYAVLPVTGITAVTISPILRNDGSGPSYGWIVMGSIPDENWFGPSGKTTLIPGKVSPESSNLNEKQTSLNIDLPTVGSLTPVMIHISRPSHLIEAGEALLFRCVLALVLSSLIVGLGTFLWLDRKFFKRLESLETQASRDTPLLLDDNKNDEIGTLCGAFNKLLEIRKKESLEDSLTGLDNRRSFDAKLSKTIDIAKENNVPMGLIMIDLNGFKGVNDRMGHSTGDVLLKEIGSRMKSAMEPENILARLGGDEFAVVAVAWSVNPEEILSQGRRLLGSFREPFVIGNSSLPISASFGIAIYPRDGETPDSLFHSADAAMYRAKRKGLGIATYDKEKDGIDEKKLDLDLRIREAMENHRFRPSYVPERYLSDNSIRAIKVIPYCEELEGLPYRERAENSGMATQIDLMVLRDAMRERKGDFLTMDLSSWHLWNDGLPLSISGMLKEEGKDPASLELTLDDDPLSNNADRFLPFLEELSSCGVSLGLRGFGKHHIPIDSLRQLPFKSLKIYREITDFNEANYEISAFASGVLIGMGKKLGMETIAIGIDTKEQLEFVRKVGFSAATGSAVG